MEPRRPVVVRTSRMHLGRDFRVGSRKRTRVRNARDLARVEMVSRESAKGTERVVVDAARVGAQREVAAGARRGGRFVLRGRRLADRAAGLRDRAVAGVDRFVRGPAGAEDAALLRERHDRDAAEIDRSLRAGGTRHRRARLGARLLAGVIPWIDACLFAFFLSGVVNMSWAAPLTTPLATLATGAFTLFLVLTVAGFTPWLGHRLRGVEGRDDTLTWSDLDGSLRALVVVWGVQMAVIGATMFARVRAETELAGAEVWTGTVLAVLLALASVTLNLFVLFVALSGSDLADDTRRRGRRLARADRRSGRLHDRAMRLDRRRAGLAARALLHETRAAARAEQRQREGDRTVELLRIALGSPDGPLPATPDLDLREPTTLRTLL